MNQYRFLNRLFTQKWKFCNYSPSCRSKSVCQNTNEEISDFIKNILIYVSKINKGLTGFERHGSQ